LLEGVRSMEGLDRILVASLKIERRKAHSDAEHEACAARAANKPRDDELRRWLSRSRQLGEDLIARACLARSDSGRMVAEC
jgi:hypothetical protein